MTYTTLRIIPSWAFFSVGLLLAGASGAQTFFTEVTDNRVDLRKFAARSTAFGDYDNDGRPDLFLSENSRTGGSRVALLHNEDDGRFVDRTISIQANIPREWKGGGAVFGDYDNDGDLDLFVPVGSYMSGFRKSNMLLRNDRSIFRDVTLEAGLTDILPTDNAIWLDFDRDGYIDLYTGNLGCTPRDSTIRNKLYRNNGDGTFADVTREIGLDIKLADNPDLDCGGGTNGGMAAGDFDDDGWPDLYIGNHQGTNYLFLNDGQNSFRETGQVADPGEAYGIGVGDINRDGSLDIFQAAGGTYGVFRSLMLVNQGQGQFLDVTEAVGLAELFGSMLGAGMADIDNDGDLDLFTMNPDRLFLNTGDGTFVDETSRSGVGDVDSALSFGDFDLDGFLDVYFGGGANRGGLYRNRSNDNHWLRVELVGVESNRSGIGTRLIATSGDLQQMREILGGLGYYQDELVAHFGLGQRTKVDQLKIRWPSGQVDVLTDIPADQKIRAFEGREEYHVVQPTVWTIPPPDSLVSGKRIDLTVEMRPALFEPFAGVVSVMADLSALGGPAERPLEDRGDGTYRLETSFVAGRDGGLQDMSVFIEQETSLGPHWIQLTKSIPVMPLNAVPEEPTLPVEYTGPTFTDMGASAGVGDSNGIGVGAAWCDYDRDGDLDLYLPVTDSANRLYRNDGDGTFTDIAREAGVDGPGSDGMAVAVSDYDGDGDLDLYVTAWNRANQLYQNNGNGTFTDVAKEAGVDGPKPSIGVGWADYDGDGDLDLYVTAWDRANQLYQNNGNGTFVGIGTTAGMADKGQGQSIGWADYDDDGDADLYVANYNGKNRLYRNRGDGSFVEVGAEAGVDGSGTGVGWADYDGDGDLDLYVTAGGGPSQLYQNRGDGTFSEVSAVTGTNDAQSGLSPGWTDYDNDGDLDLFAPNSRRGNRMYANNGDGTFTDVADSAGVRDSGRGRAAAWADYDGDGDLDLYVTRGDHGATGPNRLYRNDGPVGHWLVVELEGTASNRSGIGARVTAMTGTQRQRRDVDGGTFAQESLPVEFGLGQHTQVDELEIRWPSGQVDVLTDIMGDREIRVAEGGVITAVQENRQIALPATFVLSQNYPNPFNSSTVIRFALPTSQQVELAIYNLTGQQVAILASGTRPAGAYKIHWDGRHEDGRELASGVYLYRLQVGEGQQIATRKLVLIR